MKKSIIYEKHKKTKIATITLNRPEKLNALDFEMYDTITRLVQQVNQDDDVKVLVLKGVGRCFCAGLDVGLIGTSFGLGEPGERRPSQRARLASDSLTWGVNGHHDGVLRCKKATIAQVHGYCYGAGLELAMPCDITIAAEDALFSHPGFRYIGPLGNIALYIETIGVKKAKEMMLTGIALDAREAYRVGLVNKVVPLDKLQEEVNNTAEAIACLPIDGIVMGKAGFEAALDVLGVGAGATTAYIMHSLQTNIRYEPDEFNLIKERKAKGTKGAILRREAHYKAHPLGHSR